MSAHRRASNAVSTFTAYSGDMAPSTLDGCVPGPLRIPRHRQVGGALPMRSRADGLRIPDVLYYFRPGSSDGTFRWNKQYHTLRGLDDENPDLTAASRLIGDSIPSMQIQTGYRKSLITVTSLSHQGSKDADLPRVGRMDMRV